MKKSVVLLLVLILGIGGSAWATERSQPETFSPGGDVTPLEAYQMLQEDPEHTFLIDCRTRAEYELVGHPPMAYNFPYMFWFPGVMRKNPSFVRHIVERFEKTDRLLMISRQGIHSLFARDILREAAFKHVFNVLGGFEGDEVQDKNSTYHGYRGYINGWKHDGLPYTYEMNERLTYPCSQCE